MEGYDVRILPEYLMIYRLHDKQITETTLSKQHKEVVEIQKRYYSMFLEAMNNEQEEFYINGIYFRENIDINKFCKFFKWLKTVNKKTKSFDKADLNYAMFEILA